VGNSTPIRTGLSTGKVKRISNDGRALVGPCNIRGRALGPEAAGTVRLLASADSSVARESLNSKYGLQKRVFGPIQRLIGRGAGVYRQISPALKKSA